MLSFSTLRKADNTEMDCCHKIQKQEKSAIAWEYLKFST